MEIRPHNIQESRRYHEELTEHQKLQLDQREREEQERRQKSVEVRFFQFTLIKNCQCKELVRYVKFWAVSQDSICCVKMLNLTLSCSVDIYCFIQQ